MAVEYGSIKRLKAQKNLIESLTISTTLYMDTPEILVTGYVNPDLDASAGAYGYAEFLQYQGKNAVLGLLGMPHEEAQFVFRFLDRKLPQLLDDVEGFEQVIIVDASDLHGFDGKLPQEKVVEVIDHRPVHDANLFPNATLQIEMVGAAVTLVAERFMNQNVPITQESAVLLHAGIISNTLNFRSTGTTDRDIAAAAWLQGKAPLPEGFWKDLFRAKSDLTGRKLVDRLESDGAWFVMGTKRVGIAQLEIMEGKELVEVRLQDILVGLETFKRNWQLDTVFLNTIDLGTGMNLLVTEDTEMQQVLERALGIQFQGPVAARSEFIMRKQIVPLIKPLFETL